MDEPILLTGGAGFIGSYLLDRLVERGVEVVVLDNFSSASYENISQHLGSPRVKLVRGDIRDKETVERSAMGCKSVIHLAANPEVRMGDPEEHMEHNIRG
ncbi:MAG: GDP-mannose 4,6-dehydratase, partial [Nitrososphaerota archaeon]